MELSRYIVHRATEPDPLPAAVLRRAVRELLLLSKLEEQRMADMGLEDRWTALGDAVDAWLAREAELDRLTDSATAERWRAVSGSADPEGGPRAATLSDGEGGPPHAALHPVREGRDQGTRGGAGHVRVRFSGGLRAARGCGRAAP